MLQLGLLSLQSSPQTVGGLATLLPRLGPFLGINATLLLSTITFVSSEIGDSIPISEKYHKLKKYNVHPKITISGISGGGSFSMMLSFIYSSFIKGAGIFAGAPFPTGLIATTEPWNIYNVNAYYPVIDQLARKGLIDSTRNLSSNYGQFIYRGIYDFTPAPFATINRDQLRHYRVPSRKIKFVSKVVSGHCIPIKDGTSEQTLFGDQEAICDCGYSSIFDMFGKLYPSDFESPIAQHFLSTGTLRKFNQDEFLPHSSAFRSGWWDFGYIYVPQRCESGFVQCRLHMFFHGCGQSEVSLYTGKIPEFIKDTGFLEAADANDIIIVFPLARVTLVTGSIGCYDIYGFTSPGRNTYSTKHGVQPSAVKKIYERVLYGL